MLRQMRGSIRQAVAEAKAAAGAAVYYGCSPRWYESDTRWHVPIAPPTPRPLPRVCTHPYRVAEMPSPPLSPHRRLSPTAQPPVWYTYHAGWGATGQQVAHASVEMSHIFAGIASRASGQEGWRRVAL